LANEDKLLPELARRLGDSTFTEHIKKLPDDLLRFISHPQKFLVQTFEELSDEQRAALTLVFLSQSKLPVHLLPDNDTTLVATSYGVTKAGMTQALMQLSGSLVMRRRDGDREYWAFWHPTFADAISEILSKRPDLIDVYVRGAKLDTLLTEVVCEGAAHIRDAVVVPLSSSEALIERLLETPDESSSNENLFEFMNHRLPRDVVQNILERAPSILSRSGQPPSWLRLRRSEEIRLRATGYSMGLLTEDLRSDTVMTLVDGATYSLDASFIKDDSILAMFQPSELMQLTAGLLAKLDSEIAQKIADHRAQADPDRDIDSQFEEAAEFLDDIRYLVEADSVFDNKFKDLIRTLEQAKEEVEAEKSPEEEDVSFFKSVPRAVQRERQEGRSVFSDVEE
jgi:hypothetical protein